MNKYVETLSKYNLSIDNEDIRKKIDTVLKKNYDESNNKKVYELLFNCIDLTTLNVSDNTKQIISLVEKVNQFDQDYPQLKNVAALCVFPNFTEIVRSHLEIEGVKIAVVTGGFPHSQTFTEIKVAETSLAVLDGADEIDVVMNLGNFLSGEFEELTDEISEIKDSCKEAQLKVILETGALSSLSNIKKASILSIYSGCDFIKTSTGKTEPAATLEAAYTMCEAIKEYHDKTGRMIGFKAAGGIVTTKQAVEYYCIIKELLGEKWLTNEYFRIGASRLANNLLTDILEEEIKYF